MAGRAELPRRSRMPVHVLDLPPHVRIFAEHLAPAVAGSLLSEVVVSQVLS